jgi:phosphoribosylglycinamide formyltransferase-1
MVSPEFGRTIGRVSVMAGRIVVLISGAGSNMRALIEACSRGEVPGEVVVVLADRECNGIEVARGLGVETKVVEPSAYPSRDAWNEALKESAAAFEPDLVVSAGFMRILSPSFVDAFAGRLINLHPSLLPAFRGAHAVRDALESGVKVTGTTVHFIDHDVDHGPILLQEAVEVHAGDTEDSLHERIKRVERLLLPRACRMILEGKVRIQEGRAASEDLHSL